METKICKKCGKELPLSEFNKRKVTKDGYNHWCKECVKQYNKQYREEHKEAIAEINRQYYQDNREDILEQQKQYRQEHKEEIAEQQKQYRLKHSDKLQTYRDANKEEFKEYNRLYYLKHREELISKKTDYNKTYSKTQMGRAQRQFQQYKNMDRRNGFGDVIDFDARWIVENIYTKKCAHCDETDWHKLGCNRIDNSKGHTKDNVEPCCFYHNCVLNGIECASKLSKWAKDNLTGKPLKEETKLKISETMRKAKRGGR